MEIQPARSTPRPRPRRRDNAPSDGESHYSPVVATLAKPLNKLAMKLLFKQEYEGLEKLPTTGGHILCPNHQSFADAPLVTSLMYRDVRFMAAKEQFVGAQGWVMARAGAFPVDRKNPGTKPLDMSRDLIGEGKVVVMFPEGGIFKTGGVEELKSGAARIATTSECESIVPITIHYQQTADPGRAGSLAIAAGVTALAATGACLSPTLRAITGALTGGFAGAQLGKKPLQKLLFTAGGAIAGAVGGALAPGAVGVLTGLGTGAVAFKFADYMAHRDTVRLVVGDPLRVEDYIQKYGTAADDKLTEDLHIALSAPKVRMQAEAPAIYPFANGIQP